MMLWMKELDPYIEVIPTNTTAILPIMFKMPGLKTTVHIALYMPTHGKDSDFVSDLAELRNCLDDLAGRSDDPIIYIRGDGNVNPNNSIRVILLQQLITDYNLANIDIGHTTYHHFVGNGRYDSSIDIILQTSSHLVTESVTDILFKHDNPGILSHHDIILSKFTIPVHAPTQRRTVLDSAPKLDHTRTRMDWSEEGKQEYCELVGPYLRQAREDWLDSSSQVSMSVLLSVTSSILTKCATMTNKFKVLGTKTCPKSKSILKVIKLATNKMNKAHNTLKNTEKQKIKNLSTNARIAFNCTKKKFRQSVRQHRLKDSLSRYHKLDSIFTNPSSAFAYIKSCRASKPAKIEHLSVGD